ncbi:unnamed protein product [Mytilus coruscus]|uniref:Immunoglobulin domain-containing protein n=1 Tax=Mytilus coruscus TaxID=42192 RepID=A0A6J8EJR9_MYTCO|nr:unnamed protein product [Mytilus coruscus]
MSTVLTLMAITVHLQMVSGILNDIVAVRVRRGERIFLKCSSSGTKKTWLGPDFNNSAHGKGLVHFSNYLKHPKLNLTKYFVHEEYYGLNIFNFQKGDTGFYRCRFLNNGTFYETKYYVSLLDEGVETSTSEYERRRDLGDALGIQVNVKETSSQLPANQRHSKPNSKLTITLIVVFLLGILLTIPGIIVRRKWGPLEQPDLIDEPAEQSVSQIYVIKLFGLFQITFETEVPVYAIDTML